MAGPTFSFASCPDTFYIRSIDGGMSWGTEVNVANSGAAIAGRNDIAVAGDSSVVIVFNRSTQNTADANPHVFTLHSPDNGATWDPPIQLTNTPGQADHGSIIGSGSAVHLAWHDSRDGNLVIYYRGSSTEGSSWDPEERVSNGTTADAQTPDVGADAGSPAVDATVIDASASEATDAAIDVDDASVLDASHAFDSTPSATHGGVEPAAMKRCAGVSSLHCVRVRCVVEDRANAVWPRSCGGASRCPNRRRNHVQTQPDSQRRDGSWQ
jgi:hypothetical protein